MFKLNLAKAATSFTGANVLKDSTKINKKVRFSKISMFLSAKQEKMLSVDGNYLLSTFKKRIWRIPLGSGAADCFLRNQHRLPQGIIGLSLVFLGTIYEVNGRKVVKSIYYDGNFWQEDFLFLEEKQFSANHQVVYISVFNLLS